MQLLIENGRYFILDTKTGVKTEISEQTYQALAKLDKA